MDVCTYQLLVCISNDIKIPIGRLGAKAFPRGWYRYTGSARKNLIDRVARHLSSAKTLRWHIDYLLDDAAADIKDVSFSSLPECRLNQSREGEIRVPGFGASDCRAGCGSHLKYLGTELDMACH